MDTQNVLSPYDKILFGHLRNGVLIHATSLIKSKHTMLSKRRQTWKVTYSLIPVIWKEQNKQIHKDIK